MAGRIGRVSGRIGGYGVVVVVVGGTSIGHVTIEIEMWSAFNVSMQCIIL